MFLIALPDSIAKFYQVDVSIDHSAFDGSAAHVLIATFIERDPATAVLIALTDFIPLEARHDKNLTEN